jgi:glycosyltransferase involved in cell wall biosynthesis
MSRSPHNNPLFGRRVVIVLTTFDLGGAERQALHLASYLRDNRGAEVAIVGLFGGMGDQPVRRMCVERRLPCLRVNMPEHDGGVPAFRSVRQFARELAFLAPDLVLPYMSLPNVLAGITWRMAGAKACVWNQRDEGRELPPSRWHNLALKTASHFISNSRAGADCLIDQKGVRRERVDIVFNGVRLPPPTVPKDVVRQNLDLSASAFLAVMLANIHGYKDHATLVRAWRIVCDRMRGDQPTLLLAGREDDGGIIRNLIRSLRLENHVRLLGPIADVSSLLHAADLGVFSSSYEGTPNAVLEMMAAGLAVVATDIPGCRDALGEEYPFLSPRQDASAFADQVLALAADPNRRAQLGAASSRRVAEEFGVERMAARTCRILDRLLTEAER